MKPISPKVSIVSFCLLVALVGVGLAFTSQPASAGSGLQGRASDAAGVRVVVTPRSIAGADKWEFEVAMDTHVKPLAEDLAFAAVLIDDKGGRAVPIAWQGDPPGGHHRKGVLQFTAPANSPKAFELQLTNVGGAALRTFRWELQ
jgi:hypothetical protein